MANQKLLITLMTGFIISKSERSGANLVKLFSLLLKTATNKLERSYWKVFLLELA
jgi:hypothetical protein